MQIHPVGGSLQAFDHLVATGPQHVAGTDSDRHHTDEPADHRDQQLEADPCEEIAHQMVTFVMLFIQANPSVHMTIAPTRK